SAGPLSCAGAGRRCPLQRRRNEGMRDPRRWRPVAVLACGLGGAMSVLARILPDGTIPRAWHGALFAVGLTATVLAPIFGVLAPPGPGMTGRHAGIGSADVAAVVVSASRASTRQSTSASAWATDAARRPPP